MWKYRLPAAPEHPPRFHQPRLDESDEVIENIVVLQRPQLDSLVALALEAHPVAVLRALRAQPGARLRLARVERRIDVDQINTLLRKAL